MERFILIGLTCLLVNAAADADEPSSTAYELAETRLLAEWVGLVDEQYALATAYYKGEHVQRDYAEAFKWYHKAADQGHVISQYRLGVMYDNGEGVPKDNDKAITWYRKAAEQGHVSGQYKLGNKYARGKGVPQNYAEAYVWFNLSAASGHEEAAESRNRYASELSRDVLAESQRRSAQLFEEIQKRKAGLLKKTPLSPET